MILSSEKKHRKYVWQKQKRAPAPFSFHTLNVRVLSQSISYKVEQFQLTANTEPLLFSSRLITFSVFAPWCVSDKKAADKSQPWNWNYFRHWTFADGSWFFVADSESFCIFQKIRDETVLIKTWSRCQPLFWRFVEIGLSFDSICDNHVNCENVKSIREKQSGLSFKNCWKIDLLNLLADLAQFIRWLNLSNYNCEFT